MSCVKTCADGYLAHHWMLDVVITSSASCEKYFQAVDKMVDPSVPPSV